MPVIIAVWVSASSSEMASAAVSSSRFSMNCAPSSCETWLMRSARSAGWSSATICPGTVRAMVESFGCRG